MNEIHDAALAFAEAGCSVVPTAADGSKAPAGKWQRYQSERADAAQITQWLGNGRYDGFGVICGAVSGGMEMLELEGRAVATGVHVAYRDALAAHGLGGLWRRVITGYCETTPSGGMHILYRVDGAVRGNTKLAVTAAGEPLIETRGEGGFSIAAPSAGRTHPNGNPWKLAQGGPASIAVITEEERDALHAVASLLTQAAPRQPAVPPAAASSETGDRPGDDYNTRAGWQEILAPHGWRCVRAFGSDAHGWRRPGKGTPGISATTRESGGLYVFSTSTPFDTEIPYSKFAAYAVLNHGGDYAAAAAQLRRDGYGAPREHDDDGIASLIGASTAAPAAALVGPRVVSLADVQPEHIDWLWGGYLPLGKVVTLDGDPGVGKSTVTLDIGARTSTGSPMPDGSAGVKGTVLILSAEDGLADTIRPRLDAAGADPASVVTITEMVYETSEGQHSRPVTIPGDLPAVERIIAERDVRLVVVDVLMAYLSGDVNSHRDQDVRRALHVLAALAERTHCCVIVLRHLNKSGGGNAIYRGGGSIGIIGAARAGFMCGRDPDDDTGQLRVFASVKMNLAAEPPALGYRLVPDELHGCSRTEWLGQSEHRAGDLLTDRSRDDDLTGHDGATGWLRSLLADGPVKAKDVYTAADNAGQSKDQAKRAKKKLRAVAGKAGMDGPWYWTLPEHQSRLDDLPEGSAKGAKSASTETALPSHPSRDDAQAGPSRGCPRHQTSWGPHAQCPDCQALAEAE